MSIKSMARSRIAIIGLGKIARDQHIPALSASSEFELVGVASPHNKLDGVPSYDDLGTLLQAVPDIDAVSICTTTQARYPVARFALERGLHVMMEKPPGVTVSEVLALAALARQQHVALFASWHSRQAAGVEPARAWLEGRKIESVSVHWKEDVRVWHPGQTWIWKPGGLGVFDPGINALSVLTRIIPDVWVLKDAELRYPRNCETPIAADMVLEVAGAPVRMSLDFLHTGAPRWDIEVRTDAGLLSLSNGGAQLAINGSRVPELHGREYPDLYRRFATLVRGRSLDVDVGPLQLVADAFLCGRRVEVEDFVE
jgi:D-galactose 1-dehydrogenase